MMCSAIIACAMCAVPASLLAVLRVSVSLHIVRYLAQHPDHRASFDAVYAACIARPFADRAAFLVESGLVAEYKGWNGRYALTHRGRVLLATLRCMRRAFGFRATGYYDEH